MQLLKLPSGKHQCLIYATAMLLGASPEWVEESLGHDGSEVWWPELGIPWCQRGVHMQEILDIVEASGSLLICYQLMPTSVPIDGGTRKTIWEPEYAMKRFSLILELGPGIVITDRHACAWDGSLVYDPNGRIADISEFLCELFVGHGFLSKASLRIVSAISRARLFKSTGGSYSRTLGCIQQPF